MYRQHELPSDDTFRMYRSTCHIFWSISIVDERVEYLSMDLSRNLLMMQTYVFIDGHSICPSNFFLS